MVKKLAPIRFSVVDPVIPCMPTCDTYATAIGARKIVIKARKKMQVMLKKH